MKIGSLDWEFMKMILLLDPLLSVSQVGAMVRVWRSRDNYGI